MTEVASERGACQKQLTVAQQKSEREPVSSGQTVGGR